MKKNVSVVIPVYNRQSKIIRALESIRTQTALSRIDEIIVVDDGSTDESVQVVIDYQKKYARLPIVLLQQPNKGAAAARNYGMAVATGYYIAFLDSDDEWLPYKLNLQLDVMEKNSDIDFLGGGTEDAPLHIMFHTVPQLYKASLRDLMLKSFPATPTIVFKRGIYTTLGGFDETLTHYEDLDYLQQICAAGYGYYYLSRKIVICDGGKPAFGITGLSSDLNFIHRDCIISLKKRRKENTITNRFYLFLRVYYQIKHWRRVLITKLRTARAE